MDINGDGNTSVGVVFENIYSNSQGILSIGCSIKSGSFGHLGGFDLIEN